MLERVRRVGMRRRLSPLTIECYQRWIRQFLRFAREGGRWRHPRELRGPDVGAFLTHLAVERRLSASSQNQATNAVVFLYKRVLAEELGADHLVAFAGERSRRPVQVPTVLSVEEVGRVLGAMPAGSMRQLMARVMYGAGLRSGPAGGYVNHPAMGGRARFLSTTCHRISLSVAGSTISCIGWTS